MALKERDVADLLTLYGLDDESDRAAIMSLARRANDPGWWQQYSDILPSWFPSYLGLETAAERIHTYEVQLVPGLLQTADYARAVILTGSGDADASAIERRVELRMQRQRRLTGAQPPQLWAVLDEAAVRRAIGGADVIRAQIASLIEATERPNITIQVLPFRVGGHAGLGGAFTLLGFPDPDLHDVVFLEQITGALYIDRPDDVNVYARVMQRLGVEAEPPDRTADILSHIKHELDNQKGITGG